jgi:hypothetical protein
MRRVRVVATRSAGRGVSVVSADDPTIRQRLAELGYSHLCDKPLEGHPVVRRNHVRFALAEGGEATDVARRVLSWFEGNWKDGRCTKPVTGNVDTAVFEYTHSEKYGTARRYTLKRLPTPPPARATAYRTPAPIHAWILAEDEGGLLSIVLHSVLQRNGAVGIRWFSRGAATLHTLAMARRRFDAWRKRLR